MSVLPRGIGLESRLSCLVISFKCWGSKPSHPSEEILGKEQIAHITLSLVIAKGSTEAGRGCIWRMESGWGDGVSISGWQLWHHALSSATVSSVLANQIAP